MEPTPPRRAGVEPAVRISDVPTNVVDDDHPPPPSPSSSASSSDLERADVGIDLGLALGKVRVATHLERRALEEWNLFARQWFLITAALFTLFYLVLMVFLNLSYYRYRAPPDGQRLRDLGHEIVPQIPDHLITVVDIPMYALFFCGGVVLLSTFRACLPWHHRQTPYFVNIFRRFVVCYAAGHVLRGFSYLPTTIPGGVSKCMDEELLAPARPTLAQCFYRTASVETNCGDEMFSGHMLLCVLITCAVHEYAPRTMGPMVGRFILACCVVLTFTEAVTIIGARHHYTSDVVVAVYVTPLVWMQYLAWHPDLEPDHDAVEAMIQEGRVWCLSGRWANQLMRPIDEHVSPAARRPLLGGATIAAVVPMMASASSSLSAGGGRTALARSS